MTTLGDEASARNRRRIGILEAWRLFGLGLRRSGSLSLYELLQLLPRPCSARLRRRLDEQLALCLAALVDEVGDSAIRVPPSFVRAVLLELLGAKAAALRRLDPAQLERLALYGLHSEDLRGFGAWVAVAPDRTPLGRSLEALGTAEVGSPLLAFVDLEMDGAGRITEVAVVLRSGARQIATAPFTGNEAELVSAWLEGAMPVAHNGAVHDFPLLQQAGVTVPSVCVDTLQWAQLAWPTAPSHALPTLARRAGVLIGDRHSAMPDALLLADSFNVLQSACSAIPPMDLKGVRESLRSWVPTEVIALMLGPGTSGTWLPTMESTQPESPVGDDSRTPSVVIAPALSAAHLNVVAVVATLEQRDMHSAGLTHGWMLRGDRMIDAAALAGGLAQRGWCGAIAVRLLTEAGGALCMWPKASAAMTDNVPVMSVDTVCSGSGPWLTDLESLPTVAPGRPVVLDDAVALLLDSAGLFDPARHKGPLTLRVAHSGRREASVVRLWRQVLGSNPTFEGADPVIAWSVTLVSGLATASTFGARLARTAGVAAQLSATSSTMLVTTTEQHAFVAQHLAAPWRRTTGSSLLRPGDWPTFPETIERLQRGRHLVVASTVGATRLTAHVDSIVVDQVGTPRLDGTVINRLLGATIDSGAEPYTDVIEPAVALRLMRLLASGSGNVLLCDPRCDSPTVRRLLNARGTWSSQHISTLEAGELSSFVYGTLIAALPAHGTNAALKPAIDRATRRLLDEGGSPRPFQTTVLQSLADGRDVLAVFRTGQGKSLCYQAFGLALAEAGYGTTVVVSPLVALQRDQVQGLHRRGVWEATAINGSLQPDVRQARLRGIANGFYRLVYVAPEGLLSYGLRRAIGEAGLGGLAVDEAHCISEMGHDFRPDYRTLPTAIRRLMGLGDSAPLATMANHPRLMAFTGTASPAVRADIASQLGGTFVQHIDSQFVRPELRFQLTRVPDEATVRGSNGIEAHPLRLRLLGEALDRTRLPGIIYAATRNEADQLAAHLAAERGLRTLAYHSSLEDDARRAAEEAFRNDEADIICATNAFGMGVDKANVRTVIHWRMPGSPEALYQEAGRAGRGPEGQPADCIVLFHPNDLDLAARIRNRSVPSRPELEAVWATLEEFESLQPGQRMLWSNDADLAALAGLRAAVPVSVCLAYLGHAKLVHEIDRIGAAGRVRAKPGPLPDNLTAVEDAILTYLFGHPDAQVTELLSELAPVLSSSGDEFDLLGLQAALDSLRSHGLVETAPPGARLRPLCDEPGEKVRRHLLLCHRILTAALGRGGKWTDVTAERSGAELPLSIAAVETLAAFDLVRVAASQSATAPPAILPKQHSRDHLEQLGRLARPVLAAALPQPNTEQRCDYAVAAAAAGCKPADVRRILVAAHHASALTMLPQDDGPIGGGGAHTFRYLRISDVSDPTSALNTAEAAAHTRLERDQLRRLALDAYSELEDGDEDNDDVRQGFLERYFTDPSFLDDLRDARVSRDVCSNLDDDQRAAVTVDHSCVALIAGAGTGKTRTLTRRIAYRSLTGGVLADHMLAVCFGREAANEMRERLAALGVHVPVRTLNSFGGSIISDFFPLLGYKEKPKVVEIPEQQRIMRQAIDSLPGMAAQVANAMAHLKTVSTAKAALTPLGAMPPAERSIYVAYERHMHVAGRIDFDDQFAKALEIMNNPDAARHVRAGVRELFIDEAQDLNPAQWELLQSVGTNARLTAVGDPRQAIYEFRGAQPGLFTDFANRNGTHMLPLRFNYRSVPAIVDSANKLVVGLGLPALRPTVAAIGSVTVQPNTPDAKLGTVVRRWLDSSIPDDKVAVLASKGTSVQRAAATLRTAGISVQEVGIAPLHTTTAFEVICLRLPELHVTGDEATFAETLNELFHREDVQLMLANAAAGGDADPADDWYRVVAALAEKERSGQVDANDALSAVYADSVANRNHESGVVVTTIHKAKGLEWEAVVVFDADTASFPVTPPARLLLYVALTRARTHLVVMACGNLTPML